MQVEQKILTCCSTRVVQHDICPLLDRVSQMLVSRHIVLHHSLQYSPCYRKVTQTKAEDTAREVTIMAAIQAVRKKEGSKSIGSSWPV